MDKKKSRKKRKKGEKKKLFLGFWETPKTENILLDYQFVRVKFSGKIHCVGNKVPSLIACIIGHEKACLVKIRTFVVNNNVGFLPFANS